MFDEEEESSKVVQCSLPTVFWIWSLEEHRLYCHYNVTIVCLLTVNCVDVRSVCISI